MFKNCSDPEADSRARLGHSKPLLKYSPSGVSILLFTDKDIFTVTTLKNPQNDRLYAHPSTKKKDNTPIHTIIVFSH